MSLCGATASKNDPFFQPQALNFGKQSDPVDVLAKHCTAEVYIKKIYGNPITLNSSEHYNIFSANCLYTEEQADIGQSPGMLKAEILTYILSIRHWI